MRRAGDPAHSGVFARLVPALVFKSSQDLLRLSQSTVEIRRKILHFQALLALARRVAIVSENVKMGGL